MLIINKLSKFSKIHAGKVKKGGMKDVGVNVDDEHDV